MGRPAFVDADAGSFPALVVAPNGSLDGAALRSGFRLTSVRDPAVSVIADSASVEPTSGPPEGSPLRRAFGPGRPLLFFEVRMTVRAGDAAEALGGRRCALFDLSHPALEPSPHAVAWIGHRWERLVLAFVPDIHLAETWDFIEADALGLGAASEAPGDGTRDRLARLFSRQAFAASFINPNRRWRDFVREANRRAGRGELDLVVAGGDLVDYQLPSNLGLFEDVTLGNAPGCEPLEVPLLTVPGNHDHRRFPYRPQIYPLSRCGLHDLQRDHFFRRARGERRARLSIRDARAVLAPDGGRHPLAEYLLRIDPRPDDTVTLGRTKFILLDTGRDVFRSLGRVRPGRWGNFARAVFHAWLHPASAGLSDAQAGWLERESAAGASANLILVFHAGLSAGPGIGPEAEPKTRDLGVSPSLRTSLAAGAGVKARVRLEKALSRAGFGRGGLFQNQLSLFRVAATRGLNVLGLSGHFHRPFALRFDKMSAGLRFAGPPDGEDAAAGFEDASYFLGGAALGHIDPHADPGGQPGFTRVEIVGDRITSVGTEAAPPAGRAALRVRTRQSGKQAVTSVIIGVDAPGARSARVPQAADIILLVFTRPRKHVPGGFPLAVEEVGPEGTRPGIPCWIGLRDRKDFFGGSGPAYAVVFRGEAGRDREFRFVPTDRSRREARVVIAVEILDRRVGEWTPAGAIWHPLSVKIGGGSRRPR
ncbi:MAG: metallophosphoesterase [Candidatus Aminicenantes bacterium]|nr:metallophosphoesterase [Candidatus Aminicenantes bacterium]